MSHPSRAGGAETNGEVALVTLDGETERALHALVDATALMQLAFEEEVIPPPEPGEVGEPAGGGAEGEERDQEAPFLEAGILTEDAAVLEPLEGEEPADDFNVDELLEEAAQRSPRIRALLVFTRLSSAQDELKSLLLQRLLEGAEAVPGGEVDAAAERTQTAAAAVAELLDDGWEATVERGRDTAMLMVAEMLRSEALETSDVALHLAQHDGQPTVAWRRVPPETAAVWLLKPLYERLETALAVDPLLRLERRASLWWFLQWSAERQGDEFRFAQEVREQEWSLVDRPALATGVPVIAAFRTRPEFEMVAPRQQVLARMLDRSFVGVFVFRGEEEDVPVWESLTDGKRFRVYEHDPHEAYTIGAIGVGRLIPWEGHVHLRSPGMVIVPDPDPEFVSRFAGAMRRVDEADMPPAIALEALLSVVAMGAKVPRRLKPAANRAEAKELIDQIPGLLEEYDLAEQAEDVEPEEVPDELRAVAERGDHVKVMRYRVDQAMGDWMRELQRMAATPGGSPSRSGKARGKKGKGKKKRR
jgi:hypothetical protein